MPRVVAVPVGSVVAFPNAIRFTTTSSPCRGPGTFNLGRYPSGQSKAERFDKPGIVSVFCDIHSHMSATVIVFDHPWFAVPDADGRFELPACRPAIAS